MLMAKKAEGKQRVTAKGMGFSLDDGNVPKQTLARTARAEIFTRMATKFSSLRVNLMIHELNSNKHIFESYVYLCSCS